MKPSFLVQATRRMEEKTVQCKVQMQGEKLGVILHLLIWNA